MTKIYQQWHGDSRVKNLLRKAEKDTDPVSMFHIGEHLDDVEVSVVVLKGHDVIQCFRDWAERNKIFTPGKDVES